MPTRVQKSHDVAELAGSKFDPRDPPSKDNFHAHFKSERNKHKAGQGFKYRMTPDGHHYLEYPKDETVKPQAPVIQPQMTAAQQVELRLEADELSDPPEVPPEDSPADMKSEIGRLLPTRTYRFGGNSLIHAPGMIAYARTHWLAGDRASKAQALKIIKSWPGLPDKDYKAILAGKCHIATEGDTAVVTIKDY